jgi:DNA-binding LacI/PurR family transcriptional regulator
MQVSLTDVAKAAGVSIATASRVLTGADYPVADATRQKVVSAAQQLGYQPNLVARSLRTDRSHTVGVIADDLLSPFTPPILRGIQDHLKTVGYLAMIVNSDWDPAIEREAMSTLLSRAVEGIIFVESGHLAPTKELEDSQKPFVYVHRLFGSSIRNSIVPDDYGGARLAVEHLICLGHRRIAHIAGPQGWHSARRRLESYLDTLPLHGIEVDPALIAAGDWEYEGGEIAAAQLLAMRPLPTAMFVANDEMALGAIAAIRSAGLHVPEDVALVSYDNRTYCRVFRPKLTTVSLPAYRMGRRAAELLWAKLQGESVPDDEVRILGRLYVRESCGADASLRTKDEPDIGTTVRHRLTGIPPMRE